MNITGFQASDLFDEVTPHLAWDPGKADWGGERREPKEEVVEIAYTASWEEEGLRISLRNRSSDRNYVVYVVVEEPLLSGAIIHTATPVHVNGQLTHVPQSFFDREREALEKFFGRVADYNDRFSESEAPGPVNPILSALRPANVLHRDAAVRVVALMEEHQPELARRWLPEEGPAVPASDPSASPSAPAASSPTAVSGSR